MVFIFFNLSTTCRQCGLELQFIVFHSCCFLCVWTEVLHKGRSKFKRWLSDSNQQGYILKNRTYFLFLETSMANTNHWYTSACWPLNFCQYKKNFLYDTGNRFDWCCSAFGSLQKMMMMILSCVFSILMSALDNTGESPTQVYNKTTVPVNNVFTVVNHSSILCLSNCRQTYWSSTFLLTPTLAVNAHCTYHWITWY